MLKNITLTADETLIERALQRAKAYNTTLNAEFRRWLSHYVESSQTESDLKALMDRSSYVKPGKSFSRDEMNGR